jgi:hypothetical protein
MSPQGTPSVPVALWWDLWPCQWPCPKLGGHSTPHPHAQERHGATLTCSNPTQQVLFHTGPHALQVSQGLNSRSLRSDQVPLLGHWALVIQMGEGHRGRGGDSKGERERGREEQMEQTMESLTRAAHWEAWQWLQLPSTSAVQWGTLAIEALCGHRYRTFSEVAGLTESGPFHAPESEAGSQGCVQRLESTTRLMRT